MGICFVGGLVGCVIMSAIAFGVRTQQTVSERGGWRKNWRGIVYDGVFSAATGGLGAAFKVAKFGRTALRAAGRGRVMTKAWKELIGMGDKGRRIPDRLRDLGMTGVGGAAAATGAWGARTIGAPRGRRA